MPQSRYMVYISYRSPTRGLIEREESLVRPLPKREAQAWADEIVATARIDILSGQPDIRVWLEKVSDNKEQ